MKFNSPADGGLKEFYIDNLMFTDNAPDYAIPAYPQDAAPAPALVDDASTVSVYGDSADVAGTIFDPPWGQAGSLDPATGLDAAVGDVLKMTNLNYQGIQLGSAVDASQLKTLHIDLWSANPGTVKLFLVSPGAETAVTLDVSAANSWNSFDIDLGEYADVVDLSNVINLSSMARARAT